MGGLPEEKKYNFHWIFRMMMKNASGKIAYQKIIHHHLRGR